MRPSPELLYSAWERRRHQHHKQIASGRVLCARLMARQPLKLERNLIFSIVWRILSSRTNVAIFEMDTYNVLGNWFAGLERKISNELF